ncbi:hypothetical protein [Asticcacaulis biprosthecium]|uniref:hypothetical protein n=1 Tax=Asticcacaulis biprosthecium TaxID=76891 RepID=UPI0012F4F1A3|nr:hypothetical protein [Asticcacaulis biprosthecium]
MVQNHKDWVYFHQNGMLNSVFAGKTGISARRGQCEKSAAGVGRGRFDAGFTGQAYQNTTNGVQPLAKYLLTGHMGEEE